MAPMYKGLVSQLLPYIMLYRTKVILAILLSFVLAAVGGAQVALVKPLLDQGLSPDGTRAEAYTIAIQLLLLGVVNFPCRFFHFYYLRFVMDRATCNVRSNIFDKLLRLPTAYFSDSKKGQIISNIVNDTRVFAEGFKAVIDLIREPMKAVVYLAMAFWADWQLTMVILVAAPLFVTIFEISGRKVRKHQTEVQKEHGELTHNISESISASKITKAFNLESFVRSRFSLSQNRFFSSQMRTTVVEELAHPFVELIGAVAFSGVIVFAYHKVSDGSLTTGGFISFLAALALLMDPIRKFSQANVKINQAHAAGERISTVMTLQEERSDGEVVLQEFKDRIVVKDLDFSYGEGEVIRGLNMYVKKGQRVALVGLSGSGKSTLINLLLGLYTINKNKIFIDDQDLSLIDLASLRNIFGLVSQDVFLFHDTIRENLTVGKKYSEEEIQQALKVACADEFIEELPQKLDTIVGARGARLSGGQQQRLTMARAFLQNCDVLLFDEATSALDNESEKIVQHALEQLAGEKTVIAVAHRLSTIQNYDYIYVISRGQLVEEGTHSQLLQMEGEYAKLYKLGQT